MARIGETMAQVTFAMSRYSQKSDFADADLLAERGCNSNARGNYIA